MPTKIVSWNVNGLRAVWKKGFLDYLRLENPDILCLQEVKAQPGQLAEELRCPQGYITYWHAAGKPGYSGVAFYLRREPRRVQTGLGIERFDSEGRVLIAEYEDFSLWNIYFPNGQKNEERLRYKLDFYGEVLTQINALRNQGKNCIVCGDYNTAHKAIDLARPKENETTSGFLPEERAWLDRYTQEGWVDTFRVFCQEGGQYSWWSYRAGARRKNVGWRIDYHFVNREFLSRVKKAYIQTKVPGSDHCPVVIEIE